MRKTIIYFIVALLFNKAYAHEPIYGLGPETLPKYLNAIEFGVQFLDEQLQYDLGYGYGITQNWTVRMDVPAINSNGELGLGNMRLRTKYALWRQLKPGVLKRLTAAAVVSLPTAKNNLAPDVTAITLGLANGYESRRWYYFSDIGFTTISTDKSFKPGNKLKYNLVGGIRPKKSAYLKPDLVLLVELNGEWTSRSELDGSQINNTGGNTLAIAPGFLFSYRNIMLKAGVQFGLSNSNYVDKIQTNGLVSLEYHF